MKMRMVWIVLVSMAMFVLAGCSFGGGGTPESTVNQLINRFISAYEDMDSQRLANCFADPAVVISSTGSRENVDRTQMKELYDFAFAFATIYSVTITSQNISYAGSDAIIDLRVDIDLEAFGERGANPGRFYWRARKVGSQWLIAETTDKTAEL